MNSFITEIEELRSIRKKIKELQRREAEICTPKLTDFSIIPEIYKIFCEHQAKIDAPILGVYHRCKFLYVVMLLYSPSTLAGGKTLPGLNKALITLFNIRDRVVISENVLSMKIFFENYLDFRNSVTSLYEAIKEQNIYIK